jgi:hypothetical protein
MYHEKNIGIIINSCVMHQRTVALYWPVSGYCNKFVLFLFWKAQFIELFLEFYLRCNIFLYSLLMVLPAEMCVCKREITFVWKTIDEDAELLTFSRKLLFHVTTVWLSLECLFVLPSTFALCVSYWNVFLLVIVVLIGNIFFLVTNLQIHKLFRNLINRTDSNIHKWRIQDFCEFSLGRDSVGRI